MRIERSGPHSATDSTASGSRKTRRIAILAAGLLGASALAYGTVGAPGSTAHPGASNVNDADTTAFECEGVTAPFTIIQPKPEKDPDRIIGFADVDEAKVPEGTNPRCQEFVDDRTADRLPGSVKNIEATTQGDMCVMKATVDSERGDGKTTAGTVVATIPFESGKPATLTVDGISQATSEDGLDYVVKGDGTVAGLTIESCERDKIPFKQKFTAKLNLTITPSKP